MSIANPNAIGKFPSYDIKLKLFLKVKNHHLKIKNFSLFSLNFFFALYAKKKKKWNGKEAKRKKLHTGTYCPSP